MANRWPDVGSNIGRMSEIIEKKLLSVFTHFIHDKAAKYKETENKY